MSECCLLIPEGPHQVHLGQSQQAMVKPRVALSRCMRWSFQTCVCINTSTLQTAWRSQDGRGGFEDGGESRVNFISALRHAKGPTWADNVSSIISLIFWLPEAKFIAVCTKKWWQIENGLKRKAFEAQIALYCSPAAISYLFWAWQKHRWRRD